MWKTRIGISGHGGGEHNQCGRTRDTVYSPLVLCDGGSGSDWNLFRTQPEAELDFEIVVLNVVNCVLIVHLIAI